MAVDSIAELVATFGLAIDEATWAKGMELLEKARGGVEKLAEASEKAEKKEGSAVGELNDKLKEGLETLLGYEGVKSIEELVEHTMEATIEAKHLGERLGITTAQVQALGYAAGVTGSSSGVMATALQRLSFNLNQTGLRTGFAQHAFSQLGISMSELKKLPLNEQLGEIADKFKKMPDGPAKVALAMQLFGRTAGPQLVPLLNEGKEGIAELTKEAEELGVTTGEENVEKAEKLERAQKKLQARWGAMKDEIAFALIPTITKLADAFSLLSDFLRKHEPVLVALLGGIAAALIYVGVSAAIAWAAVIGPVVAIIAGVAILIGWVETVIALFEGRLHGAIKAVAIVVALMFAPLTILILAIVGIVKVVQTLIHHWDELKESISDAWDYIVSDIQEGGPLLAAALTLAFGPIGAAVAGLMWIIDHWDAFTSAINVQQMGEAALHPEKASRAEESAPAAAYAPTRLGTGTDATHEGGSKTTHNIQNNNVTIHTGASEEQVEKVLHKTMRNAFADKKRGG